MDVQDNMECVWSFSVLVELSVWISGNVHYIRLRNANKAEPTLALKPRGDVTRNPKQGYQWPQNRTCECVRQKKL